MTRDWGTLGTVAVLSVVAVIATSCTRPAVEGEAVDEPAPAESTAETNVSGASLLFARIFRSAAEGSGPNSCCQRFPEVKGLLVGPDNDIWIAGTFVAPLELGSPRLTSAGSGDIFVARLDPFGEVLWSTRIGDTGMDECKGFALDGRGNAIVARQFPAGGHAVTLVKLSPDGERIWQKDVLPIVDQGYVRMDNAASNRVGGIVIVGHIDGTVSTGSSTLRGSTLRYVAQIDEHGEVEWATHISGGSDNVSAGIAVDDSSDIVVGDTNTKGTGFVLSKFDPTGSLRWQKRFRARGGRDVVLSSIAVDASGNILLNGTGPASWGGDLEREMRQGPWIVKLDSTGQHLWWREAGFGRVVAGPFGNVLFAGDASASMMNASGEQIWTWSPRVPDDARVDLATVDARGRLLFAGSFRGNGPWGSGPLSALFIAALAP